MLPDFRGEVLAWAGREDRLFIELWPTWWRSGLGYRLHRRFGGLGEQGVRRVVGYPMCVNTASRRVLEKSGLRFVRTFFQDWPDHVVGAEHGDVEYALAKDDGNRQHGLP